jgi:hypothetical protein
LKKLILNVCQLLLPLFSLLFQFFYWSRFKYKISILCWTKAIYFGQILKENIKNWIKVVVSNSYLKCVFDISVQIQRFAISKMQAARYQFYKRKKYFSVNTLHWQVLNQLFLLDAKLTVLWFFFYFKIVSLNSDKMSYSNYVFLSF